MNPNRQAVSSRTRRLVAIIFVFGLTNVTGSLRIAAEDFALHKFQRKQLTDVYYSEGANAGDLNNDGAPDVVYGPYWFEGPAFETKHEIYPAKPQPREQYSDNFFSWIHDFDRDGWNDVFVVGFPGTPAYVYENPGADKPDQHWKKHEVFDWVSNESPHLTDLVGDDRPELVCTRDGFFGFATIDPNDPLGTWKFHAISEKITATKFGHGLGVGDVNGDGRQDVIFPKGWFEQPETGAGDGRWKLHEAKFGDSYGGAEMYAYDVDGDGDNDVITSLAAHDFGLAWFEQARDGDQITFKQHLIMGSHPSENRYGVLFSELHSVNLADMDGDGLKDIVTGKTFYSHHRQSPMWDAGAVVYWFRLVRGADGVDWVPYQADGQAGIGRQVSIADVNKDGLPDIVVGGMVGAHVLTHQKEDVDQETWNKAQPTLYKGPPRPSVEGASRPSGPAAPIDAKTGKVAGANEGESLEFAATAGRAQSQAMGGFNAAKWSGDAQLWWTGGRPGDELTIDLPRIKGTVDVEIVLTCAKDYGIFQLMLDDKPLGKPVDLYNPEVISSGVLTFPKQQFGDGTHALKARIVGANPKAVKSYMFGLDYVRLRAEGQEFPEPEQRVEIKRLVPDEYPHSGLSAQQAARAMTLPEGFHVTVGAAEPDVKQPIAMAIDDRGRVWIAEAYEYPIRAAEGKGRDRILVFEDTDGDGSLDRRKVFAEDLNLISGLEVGFGGVWVGAAPYLLFIPDRDGDDVPDSQPEILLDGWGYQDTHETLNAFIWGPDGWLYGCHGVFTHSRVGKPGTPDNQRVPLNAAVWRYHPTRHEFEVFAHGTSNPWGVDFNDHGQAFLTACVIPHLFHVIQGARYHRQGGQHFNRYTYQDITTIADHRHYLGANPHGGNDKSDEAGGGHAHAGAMIYLGGDWPDRYRDRIFMNNIHGQRLNMDILKPSGSGYVGSHGPDFLLTGDRASQILNWRVGPDGQAWMIDWYDMQACHRGEVHVHDRSNGRIYKVAYGPLKQVQVDLQTADDAELVELQLHENDWYVRHARRILQERAAGGALEPAARERLAEIARTHADSTRRLRAAWALHVTGGVDEGLTRRLLSDANAYVRGWAIQLSSEKMEDGLASSVRARLEEMAAEDPSPVVRLYLASALQRVPPERRWTMLSKLASHSQDADDHNLPLMYWYAAEPLADVNTERALAFGLTAGEHIPLLRRFMLRRIGSSDPNKAMAVLVRGLDRADNAELQLTYLEAMRAALRGQRQATPPAEWKPVFARIIQRGDSEVKLQATALGVTFGDQDALASLRAAATATGGEPAARRTALRALIEAGDPQLAATLQQRIADTELGEIAIRGLAQYDDPKTADAVLDAYAKLSPDRRRAALGTLCSRAAYGTALLKAIGDGEIAGTDLTADLVRQLQFLKSDAIDEQLSRVWGSVRESAEDKIELIAHYTRLAESPGETDVELGRAVFQKTCQKCHTLYGQGENVGPDLTGSNRSNLEYLLSNIVDPSAVMAKEYRQSVIYTENGRVVTGIVKEEDQRSVTVQTADAVVIVPREEIDERVESDKSMMPDDQLKQFSDDEIRSLVAYLRGKRQVPLLATADNSGLLFNGQDLTGWSGNAELWSVDSGEIVGRAAEGLRRNEFLISDLTAGDFRLSLEVKLVDNRGNSGIQFRSEGIDGGDVKGYQADVGAGWWGKLYEEHGRALLWDKSGEQHVKPGKWNRYEIVAEGSRVRTYINDQLCVDLDDPAGARRGIFALQLHSGGPTEVRFRDLRLECPNETRQVAAGD